MSSPLAQRAASREHHHQCSKQPTTNCVAAECSAVSLASGGVQNVLPKSAMRILFLCGRWGVLSGSATLRPRRLILQNKASLAAEPHAQLQYRMQDPDVAPSGLLSMQSTIMEVGWSCVRRSTGVPRAALCQTRYRLCGLLLWLDTPRRVRLPLLSQVSGSSASAVDACSTPGTLHLLPSWVICWLCACLLLSAGAAGHVMAATYTM